MKRWLDKEEYKAKMECLDLLKYNKLIMKESERKYYIATLDNCLDFHIFKKWLLETYKLKEVNA